jgi:hypothetical protein
MEFLIWLKHEWVNQKTRNKHGYKFRKKWIIVKGGLGMVVHKCNPSYLGSREWEDYGCFKDTPSKKLMKHSSTSKTGVVVHIWTAQETEVEDHSLRLARAKALPYLKNKQKQKVGEVWIEK